MSKARGPIYSSYFRAKWQFQKMALCLLGNACSSWFDGFAPVSSPRGPCWIGVRQAGACPVSGMPLAGPSRSYGTALSQSESPAGVGGTSGISRANPGKWRCWLLRRGPAPSSLLLPAGVVSRDPRASLAPSWDAPHRVGFLPGRCGTG
jgi:hypothetical protein